MIKINQYVDGQARGYEERSIPYFIAEVGVNHEGSLDIAKKLIQLAAEGGADAVKFQTYKANTIASINSPAYWDTRKESTESQYKLFKKYDKFWKKEFEELKIYCDQHEVEFLSTPFDLESATFLADLMDVFKISSSDITNKPFIEYISSFGKPIILSTGAANIDEIADAVGWIEKNGVSVALLHCVLNYPTKEENANLSMIAGLKDIYPDNVVGYSDHTEPSDMKALEIATLLGAEIIEKHFTHDKTLPGNDHYHAMNSDDLLQFRKQIERIKPLLGERKKRCLPSEGISRLNARRSLVAACSIPANVEIKPTHLTWKRPGTGISPKDIDQVIGRQTEIMIQEDEVLTWDLFK